MINKAILKKVASISTVSIFSLSLLYVLFSPVLIATSQAVADDPNLLSFFSPFSSFKTALAATTGQTVVSVVVGTELTITAPANFTLVGTIGGLTGGTATGNAAFSVSGGDLNGFNMSIKASTTPALATGSYSFADYVPLASVTPGFAWSAPAAGTASFGFSVAASGASGADAVQKFKNATSACNASGGANSSVNCWVGFIGTTNIPVASTSAFSPTATTETIAFAASFTNDNVHTLASDTYTATVTATVAVN